MPTKIPVEYINYVNVFFPNLSIEIFENTGINKYAIKLIEDKQLFYSLIYSLGLIELEGLKAYI